MDEGVFKEVIIPLLGVAKTATLAISTPDDEMNHYTQLMDLHVDGKRVFKILKVGLSCGRCLRRAVKCIHRKGKLPVWKDEDRQKLLEAMYGGSEADQRLMMRETHGMTQTEDFFLFRQWIPALKSRRPYTFKEKVKYVFMGIDPAGGGRQSDWAIYTGAYEDGKYVVSFSLIAPCRPSECRELCVPCDRSHRHRLQSPRPCSSPL